MKKLTFLFLLVITVATGFSQAVIVKFTGQNSQDNEYVQLSRIEITNNTRGWTDILTYPDTIAILVTSTGIEESAMNNHFGLSQNNPNPFNGTTNVNLTLTEPGIVTMEITDVNGRIVETWHATSLQCGTHQFLINVASSGIYFLATRQNGKTSSVKMVKNGDGTENSIEYIGNVESMHPTFLQPKNNTKGPIYLPFDYGDEMTYKGYAIFEGVEIEGEVVTRTQSTSEDLILNIPIPEFECGTSTTTDIDGNTYNTLLLGEQCWMSENMRATQFADGTSIRKGVENDESGDPLWYYPNNDSTLKETYGLLYNWAAATNNYVVYTNNPIQGICPVGWHVPTSTEWNQLLEFVKNQAEYRCSEEDSESIAKSLASTSGWRSEQYDCAPGYNQSSNNASGFNAFPAGGFYTTVGNLRYKANFWTASMVNMDEAHYYYIMYSDDYVESDYTRKNCGFSIRCVRNN